MAKKKQKHSKQKVSILSLMPVAVPAANAYLGYKENGAGGALDAALGSLTGIHYYALGGGGSSGWDPKRMVPFAGALIATWGAKKLVSYAGVNRSLGALPFRL